MILDLLLITVFIAYIHLSGIIDTIKRFLSKWAIGVEINFSSKWFDCLLCRVFRIGCLYLLITGKISLFGLVVVGLYSLFAEDIQNIMILIKDLISKTIDLIYTKYIDKYER